ncbi:MAG: hypothetical protein EBR82_67995 [Caulobacteraceae bacterium]|nr:hypothetical protein [Caulobacteraceae bacterium]
MKYSMKVKGKEIGPAEVYAEPHTMTGKKLEPSMNCGKEMPYNLQPDWQPTAGVSINPNVGVKTTGIKMRGTGCATKGVMSRGPMA